MNPFDTALLRWFNSLAGQNHAIDVAVAALTTYAPILFALLFAWYFLFSRTETDRMRRTVLLAGFSGLVALGVAVALSMVIFRARPFVAMPDQVRLLVPHPNDSSFPSDHATGSAAFAAGMWRGPDRTAGWVFIMIALLVGLSRLVAGVHWPSDILASFVLGWLVAVVLFRLERPLTPVLDWCLRVFGGLEQRVRGKRKGAAR